MLSLEDCRFFFSEMFKLHCYHWKSYNILYSIFGQTFQVVVVVALLLYVHDKHLRPCRDGQLT